MLRFAQFIAEQSKIFDPQSKYEHSTHASSLHILAGKQGADHFVGTVSNILSSVSKTGKLPDWVRTKFDGAPAIFTTSKQIGKKGVKRAESHAEIPTVWNRSSRSLHNVMHTVYKHVRAISPENSVMMSDVMHLGGTTHRADGRRREVDPARQIINQTYTPNLLTYHGGDPSTHVGIAPHTMIDTSPTGEQITRPITRSEFKNVAAKGKRRGVDVISPFIDHPITLPKNTHSEIVNHLDAYQQHAAAIDHDRVERHGEMFEQYINSGIWDKNHGPHSVDKYKAFLTNKATAHKDKKVRNSAAALGEIVEHDRPHLEHSLAMFHHSREIARIMNETASQHHPIRVSFQGTSMPHEGIVSSMPVEGTTHAGPVVKFVPRYPESFSGLNKNKDSK